MRYFELRDDVHVAGRWQLGEVTTSIGEEPRLRAGIRYAKAEQYLRVELSEEGRALEYCMTSLAVPIASAGLVGAIAEIAGGDVQRIPIDIPGHERFEVLNSVRVVKCVDEARSEFVKWTEGDHRSDLAGQYRMITRLRVAADRIPSDAHFFRIDGWLIALVVSERVMDAMKRVGCLGAKFVDVT